MFLLLDPERFEFASGDIERSFVKALREDLKNIVLQHQTFHGHRMDDYVERLKDQRTEPSLYSRLAQRYCTGK